MVFQSFKMAWASIISNKMRTFLTMLGIIIGVVALVVLVSIVNGATSQVTDSIASMGSNNLTVSITDDKENPLTLTEAASLAELDGISEVAATASSNVYVNISGSGSNVSVTGTTGDYMDIKGLELASGRWIRQPDIDNHTNVVIINQDLASDALGVSNTGEAIGQSISISGIPYTVIGVLAESSSVSRSFSSYEAYIPYTSLIRLSAEVSGDVSSFVAAADSDEDLDRAEDSLKEWLLARFDQDEDAYEITNMSTIAETMSSVTNTMAIMLGGIAAISLLVGGIGIMNIMLVSVTERTREIGIRKAIGAGEGSILLQFLIEALVVSLMGCLFGIVTSWIILQIVAIVSGTTYAMDQTVVLIATVFSLMIGLIFGIYPARKAARKEPIEALHYAG